jgi:hypothetical protein
MACGVSIASTPSNTAKISLRSKIEKAQMSNNRQKLTRLLESQTPTPPGEYVTVSLYGLTPRSSTPTWTFSSSLRQYSNAKHARSLAWRPEISTLSRHVNHLFLADTRFCRLRNQHSHTALGIPYLQRKAHVQQVSILGEKTERRARHATAGRGNQTGAEPLPRHLPSVRRLHHR